MNNSNTRYRANIVRIHCNDTFNKLEEAIKNDTMTELFFKQNYFKLKSLFYQMYGIQDSPQFINATRELYRLSLEENSKELPIIIIQSLSPKGLAMSFIYSILEMGNPNSRGEGTYAWGYYNFLLLKLKEDEEYTQNVIGEVVKENIDVILEDNTYSKNLKRYINFYKDQLTEEDIQYLQLINNIIKAFARMKKRKDKKNNSFGRGITGSGLLSIAYM